MEQLIGNMYSVEDGVYKIIGEVDNRVHIRWESGLCRYHIMRSKLPYNVAKSSGKLVYEGQRVLQSDGNYAEVKNVMCPSSCYADLEYGGSLRKGIRVKYFLNGCLSLSDDDDVEIVDKSVREAYMKEHFITNEFLEKESDKRFKELYVPKNVVTLESLKEGVSGKSENVSISESSESTESENVLVSSSVDDYETKIDLMHDESVSSESENDSISDCDCHNADKNVNGSNKNVTIWDSSDNEESKIESMHSFDGLEVGKPFRNKVGVLITPIKVNEDSVELAVANKSSKVMKVNKKDLKRIDYLGSNIPCVIGEVVKQRYDLPAKCISQSGDVVWVQFECLQVVRSDINTFKSGGIVMNTVSERYLGKSYKQKNGIVLTVVLYNTSDSTCSVIDSKSGLFVSGVKTYELESGSVQLGVGDKGRNSLGMAMKVEKYNEDGSILVSFEDGSISCSYSYTDFRLGDVYPDYVYKNGSSLCIGMIQDIKCEGIEDGAYVFNGKCIVCGEVVKGTKIELFSHTH